MTAMLAFCRCGHTRDDHVAGGGCIHVNQPNRKLQHLGPALCTCMRFEQDPRLVDSDDFVGKVLEKVIAKEAIPLEHVEREEALQVLRVALWKTSVKYDSRSHVRFRVYAYLELYNDAIDHFRSERGRHGQHRVFDGRNAELDDAFSDEPTHTGRLDGAASRDPADDPDAWATDGGGLLAVGDSPPAEPARRAGGGDAQADGRRDRRAGVRDDRRPGTTSPPARRTVARRPAFIDCDECGWRTYLQPPNGIPGWHDPETCGSCGGPLTVAVRA